MQGTIASYRRGRKTQTNNHMIILVDGIESRENAEKVVGKTVSWEAPGKQKKVLSGKIAAPHGRKGAVRAIFERGLPGQSVGKKVKIE